MVLNPPPSDSTEICRIVFGLKPKTDFCNPKETQAKRSKFPLVLPTSRVTPTSRENDLDPTSLAQLEKLASTTTRPKGLLPRPGERDRAHAGTAPGAREGVEVCRELGQRSKFPSLLISLVVSLVVSLVLFVVRHLLSAREGDLADRFRRPRSPRGGEPFERRARRP